MWHMVCVCVGGRRAVYRTYARRVILGSSMAYGVRVGGKGNVFPSNFVVHTVGVGIQLLILAGLAIDFGSLMYYLYIQLSSDTMLSHMY